MFTRMTKTINCPWCKLALPILTPGETFQCGNCAAFIIIFPDMIVAARYSEQGIETIRTYLTQE